MKVSIWILMGVILMAASVHAVGVDGDAARYYVSTQGDDRWSGRLPEPNSKRTDGPLASLERARDAVRELRKKGDSTGPVRVLLREGVYHLRDTLVFGVEDSGSDTAPVIYQSYPGERAFLSGGRVIGEWRKVPNSKPERWETVIDDVKGGQWHFRQLFAQRKGEPFYSRRFRPCKGMLAVADLTWSPQRKSAPHRAAQDDFVFFPGDLKNWANLDDVEVVALHSWSASRLRIANPDMQKNIVKFTAMPTFRIGSWYKDERNPYYVENVKEELKRPGQWYLDRPTGTLIYLPLPGETLQNTTFVAPKLERLIAVKGGLDGPRFVQNITFESIGFLHTEWPLPLNGYDTSQGQPQLSSAIEVTAGKRLRFERCIVANTGAYGIGLGVGSQECSVVGCLMYALGGGGVKVGESSMNRNSVYPVLPTGNVVENNTITDTGRIHYSANSIWCGVVKGTRIRHNTVRNNPYTGIAVGWCWDDGPSTCGENLIERNHVHHIMQLVQDGGAIYTLGRQPGTVIRGNLLHDSVPSQFACSPGQCGLYFDEGSTGFLVEDNIQYNVAYTPREIVHNKNTAKDHDIRTNYLGVSPDAANFPREVASRAGVESAYRWELLDRLRLLPDPVHAMQWPTLPPLPKSFTLDFEDVPVGFCPRRFAANGVSGKASIGVSEDTAKLGRRSLKFVDQKGLPRIFYPYLSRMDMDVREGPVEFSFDLKQDKSLPGRLWVELRDYSDKDAPGSYYAGPSVGFLADGQVMIGKERLTTAPAGEWCRVLIRFSVGAGQLKQWEIQVALPDGSTAERKAPYLKQEFAAFTGLIFSADADAEGMVYVDNLSLKVVE